MRKVTGRQSLCKRCCYQEKKRNKKSNERDIFIDDIEINSKCSFVCRTRKGCGAHQKFYPMVKGDPLGFGWVVTYIIKIHFTAFLFDPLHSSWYEFLTFFCYLLSFRPLIAVKSSKINKHIYIYIYGHEILNTLCYFTYQKEKSSSISNLQSFKDKTNCG